MDHDDPVCGICDNVFEYGSIEIESRVLGVVTEICIGCAARKLGMTKAEIIALMDANDGQGSEVVMPATTTIEVKIKEQL